MASKYTICVNSKSYKPKEDFEMIFHYTRPHMEYIFGTISFVDKIDIEHFGKRKLDHFKKLKEIWMCWRKNATEAQS